MPSRTEGSGRVRILGQVGAAYRGPREGDEENALIESWNRVLDELRQAEAEAERPRRRTRRRSRPRRAGSTLHFATQKGSKEADYSSFAKCMIRVLAEDFELHYWGDKAVHEAGSQFPDIVALLGKPDPANDPFSQPGIYVELERSLRTDAEPERASNRSEAGSSITNTSTTPSLASSSSTPGASVWDCASAQGRDPTCRLQILWSPLLEDQLGSDTLDSNSVPELYANLYRFFSFVAPKLWRGRALHRHSRTVGPFH